MSKTTAKQRVQPAPEAAAEQASDQPRQNWNMRIRIIPATAIRDAARKKGLQAHIENTERGQEVVIDINDWPADEVYDLAEVLALDYVVSNG